MSSIEEIKIGLEGIDHALSEKSDSKLTAFIESFAESREWTTQSIQGRQESLAGPAVQTWPGRV